MDTPVSPYADPTVALGRGRDDGLTDDHFRAVVRLVPTLPGRWFIERCEDDLGFVSVLLVQDVGGEDGLIFALSRLARGINLDLCLGEHIAPLGTFGTIERAMERIMDHVRHASPEIGRGTPPGGRGRRGTGAAPPDAVAPGGEGRDARAPDANKAYAGFERVAAPGLPGARLAVRALLRASRLYGRFGRARDGRSSLDECGMGAPVAAPGGRPAGAVA